MPMRAKNLGVKQKYGFRRKHPVPKRHFDSVRQVPDSRLSSLTRSPEFARFLAQMGGRSPLTVAGAVTALAPFGSSAPCSLLISEAKPSKNQSQKQNSLFPRMAQSERVSRAVCRCALFSVGAFIPGVV